MRTRKNVTFETVLGCLEAQGRPVDRDLLTSVYTFTERMHRDQVRRSGEPYVTHPVYVAYILAELKFDPICTAVGLLHDVLEDTLTTRATLEEKFGKEIAELVDGVTKIGQKEYVRRDEAQAETFRKMILASARDLRVILVKLADRLHNMLTLEHKSPESRRRISRETLEIYAPIAHRLGMSKVKRDLEDLAFYHLYPLQFAQLETKIREKMRGAKGQIEQLHAKLKKNLEDAGIPAEISYRVKHYYSIYRKLNRQGIDISQLYDYLAFRIITENLRDTYAALGVVHQSCARSPAGSKTTSPCPSPTSTSRCTRRWWARAGSRPRSRSAPVR
ncbi:MAG: bifunctional (p)ppGpp synthetase/guanosine-3',5'-bis(diphosphate) 3'-pyrophosphohydrolase [Thermoanaerobaculia bacterium]|nr:bifunctional (p)ppGpp synthetase/guanosine-3',5'-bis(diphosphate) 3'-pyrophosphohydrolase [Thermoanaerobaculia bacterium]